jgi:hypothetical protein
MKKVNKPFSERSMPPGVAETALSKKVKAAVDAGAAAAAARQNSYYDAIKFAVANGAKPPIRMQSQPQSILDDAKEIIYGDREKTYGSPDKNLQAIAEYWSNHLHTRFGVRMAITPEDVCIMMTLLKAARLGNDLTHRDSLVDAVGYLALLERIQK